MTENKIPLHVGLIMDGNRRWAKRRLLPAASGHSEGVKRMVGLAEKAKELGIKYLTVYALSTENLSRPKDELDKMYSLIKRDFGDCVDRLVKGGAAIKVIGDLSLLPPDVREVIYEGLKKSPDSAQFTFIMALGYGSRCEIVRAAKLAVKEGKEVDEDAFSSFLYTSGVPDPDFIIRTGGELRLSNFLLWQAAYAELYFTDVLFPDFSDKEFSKAIGEYSHRIRRFGKV